jgi:hypothetical protein
MDLEIAIIGVCLARKEALQLAACGLCAKPLERRLGVGDHSSFTLGLGELDQLEGFRDLSLDPLIAADCVVEPGAFPEQLLCPGGIIPEPRILGLGVQLRKTTGCGLPVKDASSAVPTTCLCRRRPPESRHAWFTPFCVPLRHSRESDAKAGIQGDRYSARQPWAPAFAGVTPI